METNKYLFSARPDDLLETFLLVIVSSYSINISITKSIYPSTALVNQPVSHWLHWDLNQFVSGRQSQDILILHLIQLKSSSVGISADKKCVSVGGEE